ncbi:MAG: SDR family NAD(P)-dependent oxidoreductase [Clostridium sp.]
MKIAIVTGASSGMGRETAIQLADHFGGLNEIWLVARRMNRLDELETQLPVPVRKFDIDLTDSQQLKRLEEALIEVKPNVKVLVNASGYGKIGKVGSISLEEEVGMPDLNCTALCAVTHMVLPYMSKNSRIIQYASSAAFLPQPGFAIYAATKAFVLSYSRALGAELRGRGICVTAVCPGPVKTEFFDIAETTGTVPLYKRLTMADPVKVVRLALRDSMMGKSVSIYGFLMKAFQLLCKILPHSIILKLMGVL